MPDGIGSREWAAAIACCLLTLVAMGWAAPPARADAVLLAAGDIGECDRGRHVGAQDTALIVAKQPGAVLALGDLAYVKGSADEFAGCYDPAWGSFKDRTRPVPGNHEYGTRGAKGYFAYWGERAGPRGKGYYSFDLGAWHIVALNSSLELDGHSDQLAWLAADLARSHAACKLAFFHHPLVSSGEHGGTPELDGVFKLLYDGRVSVVLSGHDHDYERFAPMNPAGRVEEGRGLRQFVVGTGGAHLRSFEAVSDGSEARSASAWGILRLDLREDGYAWQFLPAAPATFTDQGSAACVPPR